MVYKNAIVKVYGIAEGSLPYQIAKALNARSAIGIVMRYEGGGTLASKIHPSEVASSTACLTPAIDMTEKIRLIAGLARGLAELHSINIVHGNIKPDNILLSSDEPPEVRLADFGLAQLREDIQGSTSLNITKHTRGTLLYFAPEMMVDPYTAAHYSMVSKATRKTDMYAFALVSWEILTGAKPFDDSTVPTMKVHQGMRPSLCRIPAECPQKVIDMITNCWDRERYKRMTAEKCFLILQYEYQRYTHSIVDVCISYHKSNQNVCEHIHHRLTQLGLSVCTLDPENRSDDNERALFNSQVVIALINACYQEDVQCLSEIRKTKNTQPPKSILPVFTQADYSKWADVEMYYLCQIRSENKKIWELSELKIYSHVTSGDNEVEEDGEIFNGAYNKKLDNCNDIIYTSIMDILKAQQDGYIENLCRATHHLSQLNPLLLSIKC